MLPLYITWNPSEYLFNFGGFGIRWYGMCWLIGLALGYFMMKWLYKQHKYSQEKFEPLFLYVFISILLGARLGHCLFYEPEYFLTSAKNIVEMIVPIRFLEHGGWKFVGYQGLASHGGVVGLLLGLYLYIKRYKMKPWVVLDLPDE